MDAFHDISITSLGDGRCSVHESTNDDDDDGYPDGHVEEWSYEGDLARELERHGKSRTGISGVKVSVYLDGEKL